ncbi:hypothetical protein [Methanoculleus bourgensis]|jgi:hypothetical protein|uniref:Uncharacterized protein n=1 Tax=Methanoculleus bourgensis TaxID=83986 RepID=A0A0X3BP76_9EURY|nr:hypothetical protein [Methanoculleus bourgensis]CVK33962.1 conserved protein of unknown function [Methanoculleus bourgensis]
MDILEHIQTGRDFDELCQKIGRYVNEQRKTASKFKIGITTDYNNRAEGDDYLLNGYDRMIVLYRTQSKERVCSMEQYLINRFKKYEECENIRRGGEGKLKWGPPYYAYLAMKTR